MRLWVPIIGPLILLVLLGGAPLWGQEDPEKSKAQEHEVPGAIGTTEVCPCTAGPLIADTAVPLEKGKFAVQPFFFFKFTGGLFSPSWRRISAGGDYFTFDTLLKLAYGLTQNLEVNLYLRYRHNWASNVDAPGPRGERSADFGGFGDVNFTLKYRLIEESQWRPTVAALFSVDFPTGHYFPLNPGRLGTDSTGSGVYASYLGFNVSKWVKPFIFYANLWYYTAITSANTQVPHPVVGGTRVKRIHGRDTWMLRLAAEYPLGGQGPWVALLEFYADWDTGRILGPKANSLSPGAAYLGIMPGLEYVYSDRLAFVGGVAVDVAGKNVVLEYTPILSLVYTF